MKILLLLFYMLPIKSLKNELESYLSTLPTEYVVSVAIQDSKGKHLFSHQESMQMPAASTIKVPIMMSMMEEIKKGNLALDKIILLKNDQKVAGGNIENLAENSPLSIRYLMEQMIIESDNTATNILIEILGKDLINNYIRSWKLHHTALNRIMMDFEAVKQGRENFISAADANKMLLLIYQKKIANATLCDLMISTLLKNTDKTTLPALILVKIAHKTGTLDWVRADVGVVYSTKPFIISIYVRSKTTLDLPKAEEIIAHIGQIAYNHLK